LQKSEERLWKSEAGNCKESPAAVSGFFFVVGIAALVRAHLVSMHRTRGQLIQQPRPILFDERSYLVAQLGNSGDCAEPQGRRDQFIAAP
jgi:hypothetical protein